MKLKDSELKAILSEVEAEIGSLLKNESEKLSKAFPDEEGSDESAPGAEGSAPAEASAPEAAPADEGSAPPPAPEASAPAPEASAPMAPEAPAPAADPAMDAQGPADPAMLEAEYAKLQPEELKAHYMAAKACLFKLMGAGGDSAAPAGPDAGMAPPDAGMAPPAGPEASAPAAPGMEDPMMGKGELSEIAPTKAGAGKDRLAPIAPTKAGTGAERLAAVQVTKGEIGSGAKVNLNNNGQGDHSLGKSERDELNALRTQVDGLMAALENIASPIRKAVTSVDFMPKTEVQEKRTLSRAEITSKLGEATRNPSLKKSDRELVNKYFDGAVDLGQIEHLLK